MSAPDDEEAGTPSGEANAFGESASGGDFARASDPSAESDEDSGEAKEDLSPPEPPQPFVVRCAACGAETTVTTDQAGKRGRCGVCGGTFLILPPPGFGPLPAIGVEAPESPPFEGPPHRAKKVLGFGLAAMIALAMAVVFTSCCPYVPVDLVGVGIGIAAFVMGRRDLKAMDRGEMDPSGREKTRLGYALGICAAGFGLFMVLLRFAILVIVLATMMATAAMKPAPPGGFVPPPPTTAPPQTAPSEGDDPDEPTVPLDVQGLDR